MTTMYSDTYQPNIDTFIATLLRLGVIQFGQFERQGSSALTGDGYDPLRVHIGFLGSYPADLQQAASLLVPLIRATSTTHLLTTPTATVLGTAVSLLGDIPLCYPSPTEAHHIEGAYDYQVPTCLLTSTLTDGVVEHQLIKQAQRDGLHVQTVVSLLTLGTAMIDAVPIITLLSLAQVLNYSIRQRILTTQMGEVITKWAISLNDSDKRS